MRLYSIRNLSVTVLSALALSLTGCESYFFLPGTWDNGGTTVSPDGVITGGTFTIIPLQQNAFIKGKSATAVRFEADDLTRTPLKLDFNLDGAADPVVVYEQDDRGIIQILLSNGNTDHNAFTSLTLDGNGRWRALADVAAGDIDGDGDPDLIGASEDGIIYLHHPARSTEAPDEPRTALLRGWGSNDPEMEFLAGTGEVLTAQELEAMLAASGPPGFRIEDYDITVQQGYTNVEIADFNLDNNNDVIGSRRFALFAEPKPDKNVPPFYIVGGELQILFNPGGAIDGVAWELLSFGQHERFNEHDRQGVTGVHVHDLDTDGDLDVISVASDDVNAQISWFEHPGIADPTTSLADWTAWRIGSVLGAVAFDFGDVTGDGRPDLVTVSPVTMELVLFEQPANGPKREYDWDRYVITDFGAFPPQEVKLLDIDGDGALEIIVAGGNGAVRYFDPPADPRGTWIPSILADLPDGGEVGLLGYGDFDEDGDLDIVAATDNSSDQNLSETYWIRNDLVNR